MNSVKWTSHERGLDGMVAEELEGTGAFGMGFRGGASGTATGLVWGQGKEKSQALTQS